MIRKNKGAMDLLKRHFMNLGNPNKLHCVIHQESLYAKTTNLPSLMNIATNAVNTDLLQLTVSQAVF